MMPNVFARPTPDLGRLALCNPLNPEPLFYWGLQEGYGESRLSSFQPLALVETQGEVAYCPGLLTAAAKFDSGYSLSAVSTFAFAPEFTLSFWFAREFDVDGYLFFNSPGNLFIAYQSGNSLRAFSGDGGLDMSVDCLAGWNHVLLRLAASQWTVFLNGENVYSYSAADWLASAPYAGWNSFGADDANENNFYGLIAEIGIWGRGLTDLEVASLYNTGLGLAPVAPPQLLAMQHATEDEVDLLFNWTAPAGEPDFWQLQLSYDDGATWDDLTYFDGSQRSGTWMLASGTYRLRGTSDPSTFGYGVTPWSNWIKIV